MLADAVRLTLGPKGRTVFLEKAFGPPAVTKDGVSVARALELTDKFRNMGAQLVRQAAFATSEDVGDGTMTATVIAQAIIRDGLRARRGAASRRR